MFQLTDPNLAMKNTLLKSLAFLLVLPIVLVGCQDDSPEPEPGTDVHQAAAQNEELAMEFTEAYNARDRAALEELLTDPFTYDGEEMERDAYLNLVESNVWNRFPDIERDPTHIVGAVDYVTVHLVWRGTGAGVVLGHDIDGQEVDFTETSLFRVRDGQLAEYIYNFDELGLLEQLGLLERPYPEE